MKTQLLFVALFAAVCTQAQISPRFYARPAELQQMSSRTLVVEVLTENADIIKRLSKKEKTADEFARYQSFIKTYNVQIKDAVTKYWTFTKKVEYKTEEEVKQLNKSKDASYAVLRYFELGDSENDPIERSLLKVPALMLMRMEENFKSPDYKIYFPSSFSRDNLEYLPCDYMLAIIGMQANIKWIIDNNKIEYYNKYAEIVAEPNCTRLKNYTLLVEKDYLAKSVDDAEAQEAFGGKLQIVTAAVANKSFVNREKGKAVLFNIPYGIARTNMIVANGSMLTYFKIIVDCETGDILWVHNPGSFVMGENIKANLIKDEFKRMNTCKM